MVDLETNFSLSPVLTTIKHLEEFRSHVKLCQIFLLHFFCSFPHGGGLLLSFLSSLSCLAFVCIVLLCGVAKVSPFYEISAHVLLEDFDTSNSFWKETDKN